MKGQYLRINWDIETIILCRFYSSNTNEIVIMEIKLTFCYYSLLKRDKILLPCWKFIEQASVG